MIAYTNDTNKNNFVAGCVPRKAYRCKCCGRFRSWLTDKGVYFNIGHVCATCQIELTKAGAVAYRGGIFNNRYVKILDDYRARLRDYHGIQPMDRTYIDTPYIDTPYWIEQYPKLVEVAK